VSPLEVLAVAAVGTLVALDAASVPQVMISRPLAAGLLGGALAGDPLAGLAVGALLEFFAMESLAVGAVRVPDFGPPAVACGALAASLPLGTTAPVLLGLVLVALGSAWLGGFLVHVVRRANAATVSELKAALDAGEVRALRSAHLAGLLRDAARGAAMTALTLAAGFLVGGLFAQGWRAAPELAQVALAVATVGVGLWSGWHLFGGGLNRRWYAAGLGAGVVGAALWA
jgi:mannose/fructose/N-acetylgalactosamine-specific phosphotransferase system component IIC